MARVWCKRIREVDGWTQQKKRRLDIDSIPDEMLLLIFEYVGVVDVSRSASLVCSRWASVASDDELWKRFGRATVHNGPDAGWRSMAICEINRRRIEDVDLEHRLEQMRKRARKKQNRVVRDDWVRRATRACRKDFDASLANMLTWPCAERISHAERIQLISAAVVNNSARCLAVIHRWHQKRSQDEKVPGCAMDTLGESLPTISPALYLAVCRGSIEIVRQLYHLHSVCCTSAKHGSKLTNLLVALVSRKDENKNGSMLRMLHERWVSANAIYDNQQYHTILFKAAESARQHIRHLVAIGCDTEHRDINGLTPLLYAIKLRNEESVRALLDCGADSDAIALDGTGRSARQMADEPRIAFLLR
jgi:hypothetical protein